VPTSRGHRLPDLLWEALLRGDDFVTEVPPDRWDIDEYYDPEPGVPGRSVCKWGAFMENIGDFDPEFFGIPEPEALAMDPQHRLLLETSWEAMEHAGLTPQKMADSLAGVFIGLNHGDYQFVHADAGTFEGPYGNTGTNSCMASGRVSYALGLHGPAVTVDTACSSSLFATHLACRSLNDGESDLAFVGGVYAMLEPRRFASGSASGMLSATGRCHAFDVAADGFVSGEGSVVLLLKRLPDAVRDGDRIFAVVRGTAANQDGHTVNIVTHRRRTRRPPCIARRWPWQASTPAPSASSRPTAPALRWATRSNTRAWPRSTASTARARSDRRKPTSGTLSPPPERWG